MRKTTRVGRNSESFTQLFILIHHQAGLGICSSVFWANRSFFCEKMSQWAISSKKQAIHSFTHFWWATWEIPSHCSFLVSNLSNLLTSLIKKEGTSESLVFFFKRSKMYKKYFFSQKNLSESLIRSLIMSDLSDSLTVAHLSWATWAIRSRSLFWHERPERFPRSHSFVLSDLSESLTVAQLIWAIWANERMSKFPALDVEDLIRRPIGSQETPYSANFGCATEQIWRISMMAKVIYMYICKYVKQLFSIFNEWR